MKSLLIVLVAMPLALLADVTTTPQWTPDPLCTYPSDELVFYIDPYDCTKYYQCHQGNKNVMSCPVGLYWNQERNWCDLPENVDCSRTISSTAIPTTTNRPTTSGGSTTEGHWTPDPLCPYPSNEIVYFDNPYNCSQYYECYEGNKFLMNCPATLYWNEKISSCDYASNVHCTPIGPTVAPQTTASASVCASHADGNFVENPNDCSKYYECVGNKAIEFTCPETTLWNQKITSCDFSGNVDC